jgi:LytS/YehU family sensor histidine kinase
MCLGRLGTIVPLIPLTLLWLLTIGTILGGHGVAAFFGLKIGGHRLQNGASTAHECRQLGLPWGFRGALMSFRVRQHCVMVI